MVKCIRVEMCILATNTCLESLFKPNSGRLTTLQSLQLDKPREKTSTT